MPRTIMAGDALQIDAQEDPSDLHRSFVHAVQSIGDRSIVIGIRGESVLISGVSCDASKETEVGNAGVALGDRGYQIADHIVIGPVYPQPFFVPMLEPIFPCARIAIQPEQITV